MELAVFERLKLKHSYHDALITSFRVDDATLTLFVTLCGCGGAAAGPASMTFTGVRNMDTVRAALENARHANAQRGWVDEIINVRRAGRGFELDLNSAGAVEIDSQGLCEA